MISFLTTFFQKTYELFSSVNIPGFNVSILSVWFGAAGAICSIAILKLFFGIGNSTVSGGSSFFKQKGGNNQRIKVSKERKGDTH